MLSKCAIKKIIIKSQKGGWGWGIQPHKNLKLLIKKKNYGELKSLQDIQQLLVN